MIKKRLNKLRSKFIEYGIDGYVVPKNDEFFSEHTQKDRLKFISNLFQFFFMKINKSLDI